ncbi:TlpA family protein disulfide reductase [Paucibacter sp. DJ1R-11]|uniref:TlpA disulfide reductase family protein n=1 Tax=Paucibacter sp. DJ1R-11 TaxID=2893556 RepID=UPI0021E3E6DF|nr:TlpA disulfide reductase family protein [Paucibacter sp. DJ1R-11]MCV2365384.1 TlpA family protein disulfide reductase [Paucibacter sp. DJ1R-11]
MATGLEFGAFAIRSRALARQASQAALSLALLAAPLAQAKPGVPGAGDLPPDAVGKNLDGDTILLSQYPGRAVVLTFWATWCGYCLKELPVLEKIQNLIGRERLEVIAVNTEARDVFRRAKRTLKDYKLQMIYDPDKQAQQAFGVQGIPHMLIIGRDGRIVRLYRGYSESELDAIATDIDAALVAPLAKEASNSQP